MTYSQRIPSVDIFPFAKGFLMHFFYKQYSIYAEAHRLFKMCTFFITNHFHELILTHYLEHLFNLKFASKDLERNAVKSEKSEKAEKLKLKKVCNVSKIYIITI